ncbi:ABC transporter substrate-binding protein, partial [Anaerolinea sp.]
MKIRFFTLFSMLMLVVMVFSACAPAATPTPEKVVETVVVEKEKVVEKTVEVQKVVTANVITYNSYNGDPKPRAFDESVVKMWNEAHPEMPVEHSIIAHEDFKQAIRAYLTADPAPDVLTWFAGNRARFFIDKGLILDQTKMWEDAKLNEVYAPGFQALATYNDKKYFLPTSYYWWAIYYRKSLFAEAGIEKEPETWQDLLDACDKLNAKGITPITIGARF